MSRFLLVLTFLAVAATPSAGQAASRTDVSLSVSAGFENYYRQTAWMPIRVSLRNPSTSTVNGTLTAQGAADRPRAAVYSEVVPLAAGARKVVTLDIPGSDIQGMVSVAYRESSSTLAATTIYPNPYSDTDFVVGTLSDDPVSVAWIASTRPRLARLHVVNFGGDTLPASPGALSTFDALVVSNVDTSILTGDQLSAIEQYVRNGGALVEVGGPSWQETLGSLPTPLLPARGSGTAVVPNLGGLGALGEGTPPSHIVTITRFARASGTELASQSGYPLLIKSTFGDGQIEQLAFDPSVAPIDGWAHASPLLTALLAGAAPLSMRRVALSPVDRVSSFLNPGPGFLDLGSELANFPQPSITRVFALPAIPIAAALLILLGAMLIILKWRRRPLAWVGFGVLVALCLAGAYILTPVARGTPTLTTLNVVFMGPGTTHPADRYAGLVSPGPGSYTLTYPVSSQAEDLAASGPFAAAGPDVEPATFSEGASTAVRLPDLPAWTSRAVALQTTMTFPGSVETHLKLDRSGDIVGTVVNHMRFPLRRPAVVAGRQFQQLPDIPAGGKAHVRFLPEVDVQDHDYQPMLLQIYGQSVPDYAAMAAHRLSGLPGPPAGMPPERTLDQRIKNAASALPETEVVPSLGQVTLVAWSDRTLDPVGLAGSHVTHRDLTLLVQPLSVGVSHGAFRLPTGVLQARAIEVTPASPRYPCCGPTIQPISVGTGGEATFSFQLPRARFNQLSLDMYAGGADTSASGYTDMPTGAVTVYDWQSQRWVQLRFSGASSRLVRPVRFISQTGALLIRLVSTPGAGDLTILDPGHDIQLHGAGEA